MAQFHCTAARILALLAAFLITAALSAPDGTQRSSMLALIPPPKMAADSTVVGRAAVCPTQRAVILTNTNSPGADLESFSAADADACERQCEEEPSCNVFVFGSGSCFLKSSLGTLSASTGTTLGVLNRANDTICVVVADVDVSTTANDIFDFPATRDVCCQICGEVSTCSSFSWNPTTVHCYIKSASDSIKSSSGHQMGFPKFGATSIGAKAI